MRRPSWPGPPTWPGPQNVPRPETLYSGVDATLIGRDAIAVVVHPSNPVADLSRADLGRLFTGRVASWNELGGRDLPVQALVVGPESATSDVFRAAVLGGGDFAGCEVVRPDGAILERVAADPGAIGHISFSFLEGRVGVRAIAIDGEPPAVTNFDYPVSRPLYLLSRPGRPEVDSFVAWTQTADGQGVVMRHFVGTRVVGSVGSVSPTVTTGTLVVRTETYPYYDGGIYYYPHEPYELRTREGGLLRRVPNHRGQNDEAPMRIDLSPGTYLVRTDTVLGERNFLVTVESGRLTELDVVALLGLDG